MVAPRCAPRCAPQARRSTAKKRHVKQRLKSEVKDSRQYPGRFSTPATTESTTQPYEFSHIMQPSTHGHAAHSASVAVYTAPSDTTTRILPLNAMPARRKSAEQRQTPHSTNEDQHSLSPVAENDQTDSASIGTPLGRPPSRLVPLAHAPCHIKPLAALCPVLHVRS